MSSTRRVAVMLAYGGLALLFTAPLLVTGNHLGVEDWDVLFLYHAAVIKSVAQYGRLPFWNPWYCGGDVLWQNPQVALLSPAYAFSLVTSLPMAMKLNIALHYVVGFAGMHMLLTRQLRLRYWPAVLFLACLFTLAGGPAFHLTVGHATFLPYFYLPWVLFLFLRGVQTGALRDGIAAAAILAFSVYNGGIQIAFMAALGLGSFALLLSAFRRALRPLVLLAIVGAFTVLLAAPKLLPVAAFVGNPRTVDTRYSPPGRDVMSVEMVEHAFLDPFQFEHLRFKGQNYGWHEYANYIGSFGALAIVATLVWVLAHRFWRSDYSLEGALALTTALLFALALGDMGRISPYALLQHLPGVSGFRLPSRYTLVFLLFATAVVGAAWSRFATERAPEASRWMAIALVAASCALVYWNQRPFEGAFSLAPLDPTVHVMSRPGGPLVDATSPGLATGRSPMLRAFNEDRAILQCYEPLVLAGDVQPDRPAVFADAGARVTDIDFAPGRIRFQASAAGTAGRIFLNERYVEGWHSDAGRVAIDPQTGLAYAMLAPGREGRFTFWFVPPWLITGLLLFAAGVALAALTWRRTLPFS